MSAAVGVGGTPESSFEVRPMQIHETEVVADRSGSLYLPEERALVVADLHLEKGSAFAARGVMLPPYDTRDTLDRLAEVLSRYRPRCVIALGDSFHDRGAEERLDAGELAGLRRLQARRDWIWITGNHDPEISSRIGGRTCASVGLGSLILRHEPGPGTAIGEIAGHLHPVARVLLGGARLRRPCFIANAERIVLPAFGAFTGGLNVLDDAFEPLFARSAFDVHVLGRDGVYPVRRSSLSPD